MSPALDKIASHAGEIIDAQGLYHDLTKGAFDAFSLKHPGAGADIGKILGDALKKPLKEGIRALAKKFNIDPHVYEQTDDPAQMARNLAVFLGKKIGTALGSEIAIATTAAEVTIGIPAIVGVAVESAIEWAIDRWKQGVIDHSFQRGDWVIIDKGNITTKKIDRDIDIGMLQMFEDAPDLSELHTLIRTEVYHVGFYVSTGADEGTVMVFDIMTGLLKQYIVNDVRKLPVEQRAGLDQDEFASEIRELYFVKRDKIMIASAVSTDPGTEVIFGGYVWSIVGCNGDEALIEDTNGKRLTVPLSKLKRSRQTRIGDAHIYKNGKPVLNTGFITTGGGFGTGDWVWYKYSTFAATKWVLAVVHIINGEDIVCYLAPSGARAVAKEGDLRVATSDDSDTFQRVKVFTLFKQAAIEGGDTERLKVPSTYTNIMVIDNPAERHVPTPGQYERSTKGFQQEEESVANQAQAAQVDDLIEAQEMFGVPVQNEFVGIIEARKETDFGTGASPQFVTAGGSTLSQDKKSEDNTAMYVVGALVVAGAAYYLL